MVFQLAVDKKVSSANPDQVLLALASVLSSESFKNSPRMGQLLDHVVKKTLQGEHNELNGYAIGVSVFGRSADFDPSNEPIVRVQFSRLRRALKEYYLTEGAKDSIRINLAPGNYVASFDEKPSTLDSAFSAISS